MLRLLVLTSLAALVLAELEPQPRYLEDITERVVGGDVATPNSWPWQVSLQYESGSRYIHHCGGTLIERGWVMTAAHCVDRHRTWLVVLGEHDLYSDSYNEQLITVSKVFIHNGWDSNSPSNGFDIALLRLSSPATLDYYVRLGSLPQRGQILPHNNHCIITGWGYTSTDGSLSAQLKQANLPLVDYKICSRHDWWGSFVKTTMVCGGGDYEGGCNVSLPLKSFHQLFWIPEVERVYQPHQQGTGSWHIQVFQDFCSLNQYPCTGWISHYGPPGDDNLHHFISILHFTIQVFFEEILLLFSETHHQTTASDLSPLFH